jgi:hypothetical protein
MSKREVPASTRVARFDDVLPLTKRVGWHCTHIFKIDLDLFERGTLRLRLMFAFACGSQQSEPMEQFPDGAGCLGKWAAQLL